MKEPRVYNYQDYREYLKDVFAYKKSLKVSMRKIAISLSVSNAYLTMVLNQKRNLDLKYLEPLAIYLKLNKSESSYLKNLILISDSENTRIRSDAYKGLSRFRSYKNDSPNDVITHKYLNNWYYVAIRELSFMSGFKEDPRWIQGRMLPNLKIKEIGAALDFLKKNDLLANNNKDFLDCSQGLYKLSLTHFHQDMLRIIGESIEKVERKDRMILGHTKAFGTKNFQKAQEIMKNALDQIEELEEEKGTTNLYQFYFLGSPLTYKEES